MQVRTDLNNFDKLFTDSFKFVFRIPPYQRGFAWDKKEVSEFIYDVENLITRKRNEHYTGMISVEQPDSSNPDAKAFNDCIDFLINGFQPYFVIDGQQRMTVILLFIAILLHKYPKDFKNPDREIEKYLYQKEQGKDFNIKFCYLDDNQNYNFFKSIILGDSVNWPDSKWKEEGQRNMYAENLFNAYKKLSEWIDAQQRSEKRITLFKTVTERMIFDFKVYDSSESESIYIIFETTNKRGKQLTNLELLKNRLLYLSTLNDDKTIKTEYHKNISVTWDNIYTSLGKFSNSDIPLDNKFLMDHWTMYQRHLRDKEFYSEDIFNKYFTSANYLSKTPLEEFNNYLINEVELKYYVDDLDISIQNWFRLKNPNHADNIGNSELIQKNSVDYYLYKINQFNYSFFDPIILAILNLEKRKKVNAEEVISVLKEIEKYYFLIFYVSNNRADTGSYTFLRAASLLYNSYMERRDSKYYIKNLVEEIHYLIFKSGSLSFYSFQSLSLNLFGMVSKEGFKDWRGIEYFLLEYEESKALENGIQKNQYEFKYTKYKIFPYFKRHTKEYRSDELQKFELADTWKSFAKNKEYKDEKDYEDKMLRLASSLGNIVLLPNNEVIDENMSYEEIKEVFKKSKFKSVREIPEKYPEWNTESIYKRGLELLNFITTNWIPEDYQKRIDFNSELKRKTLYLESIV